MTVLRDHGCGDHGCGKRGRGELRCGQHKSPSDNSHAGDVLAFAERAAALAR